MDHERPIFMASELILLGALTSLIAILTLTPISNNDIFWQLRTGQEILSSRSIPRVDPYSASAAGNPWTNHEWLAEVFFTWIHGFSGFNGLIGLKFLLVLASFLILYAYARKSGTNHLLLVFLALPVLFASTGRFVIRPHLISLLFFSVSLVLLLSIQPGRKNRFLLVLPFQQILWANCHGGFLVGIALPAVFLAAHTVRILVDVKKGKKTSFPPSPLGLLSAVVLLNFAASLLNPFGFRNFTYLLELDRSSVFLDSIYEWLPSFSATYRESYLFYFYIFWLFIACGAFLARKGRVPLCQLFPFLALLYLSIRMNRNMDLFCFGTYPLVAGWLMPLKKQKDERLRSNTVLSAVLTLLILFGLIALNCAIGIRGFPLNPEVRKHFGFGLGTNRADHAAGFIQKHGIRGNAFNAYSFGGDLIFWCYPETKVIMDSRNLVYGKDFFKAYTRALKAWLPMKKMLERYRADYILLQYPRGRQELRVQEKIWEDPGWELVYFDDVSILYVKNTNAYHPVIQTHRYRCLNPILFENFDFDQDLSACYLEESLRSIRVSPASVICRNILVRLLILSGEFTNAMEENAALFDLENGRYHGFYNQGLIHFLQEDYEKAEAAFKKALRENPNAPEPRDYLSRISNHR